MILKNRYCGRNSSLTLFIPDQTTQPTFKKYFASQSSDSRPKNFPINNNTTANNYNNVQKTVTFRPSASAPTILKSEIETIQNHMKETNNRSNSNILTSSTLKSLNKDEKKIKDSEPICDMDEMTLTDAALEYYAPYFGNNLVLPKLNSIPSFSDSKEEFMEIFRKKCKLCKKMCNFNYANADVEAKQVKADTLNEILKQFDNPPVVRGYPKILIKKTLKMVLKNLERPFRVIDQKNQLMDDIFPSKDPTMAHLIIVYQIQNRILQCLPHTDLIDISYLKRVIRQLGSIDQDERNAIQSFILTYFNYNDDEPETLFEALSNYLVYAHESQNSPFAIAPILNIMLQLFYSMNSVPIEFDKIVLATVIPLLNGNYEPIYHPTLSSFVINYVQRRPKLAISIAKAIIKYFPRTRNQKQCFFLKLITNILPNLYPRDVYANISKIAALYAEAACSMASKVVLCALQTFTDPSVETIISDNSRSILPIVFKPFMHTSECHWNKQVKEVAKSVLTYLRRLNPKCFKELMDTQNALKVAANDPMTPRFQIQEPQMQNWFLIARIAGSRYNKIDLPNVLSNLALTYPANVVNCVSSFNEKNITNLVHTSSTQIGTKFLNRPNAVKEGRRCSCISAAPRLPCPTFASSK